MQGQGRLPSIVCKWRTASQSGLASRQSTALLLAVAPSSVPSMELSSLVATDGASAATARQDVVFQRPLHVAGAGSWMRRQRQFSMQSPGSEEFMKTNLQVDTLELADKFEDIGLSREQARAITRHIAELVVRNNVRIAQECTSPVELEKALLELQATITGFKTEVLKTQELHLAALTRDTERLQNESDKIRAELKYEINKLTASQRLDLNLEKGRIRDELAALREKSNDIEVRIDKDINGLRTSLEASKNDIIRYCVGTIMSVAVMGLGVARLLI